ncbi:microsomal signal peptidase subunit [Cavenderia fasciculata]|uniref:Signal peptidase complex subunit 3 n=1 Tax=Cavenderia fasciculata TaxID=261658 RepID=F4PSY2_CACFS|nr:microsomal signal peptidase subunit [Cavenderia fasciculata]EGG20771.1 microsomal signal peptidase subunit [Cavenderia fasciculata]|eukprot:XP_004358621.1 microsomal signal peptidase subunit [Cavenderia fasciculata]
MKSNRVQLIERWGLDYSIVTTDLTTDLTPLFNWNTKQLFLYITAEYVTPTNVVNQVVIWDKIVTDKDMAVINEKNIAKYYLGGDQRVNYKNLALNITFNYNVIPISGWITTHQQGSYSIKIPPTYN